MSSIIRQDSSGTVDGGCCGNFCKSRKSQKKYHKKEQRAKNKKEKLVKNIDYEEEKREIEDDYRNYFHLAKHERLKRRQENNELDLDEYPESSYNSKGNKPKLARKKRTKKARRDTTADTSCCGNWFRKRKALYQLEKEHKRDLKARDKKEKLERQLQLQKETEELEKDYEDYLYQAEREKLKIHEENDNLTKQLRELPKYDKYKVRQIEKHHLKEQKVLNDLAKERLQREKDERNNRRKEIEKRKKELKRQYEIERKEQEKLREKTRKREKKERDEVIKIQKRTERERKKREARNKRNESVDNGCCGNWFTRQKRKRQLKRQYNKPLRIVDDEIVEPENLDTENFFIYEEFHQKPEPINYNSFDTEPELQQCINACEKKEEKRRKRRERKTKGNDCCNWFQKRQALRKLEKEHKKEIKEKNRRDKLERQIRLEQEKRELEEDYEDYLHLAEQEKIKRRRENEELARTLDSIPKKRKRKFSYPRNYSYTERKATSHAKTKYSYAKPKLRTKRTQKRRPANMSEKLSNCCYRFFCKVFCMISVTLTTILVGMLFL